MTFLHTSPAEWTFRDWQRYWLFVSGFWFVDQLYGATLHGSLSALNSTRPIE